MSYFPNDLEDLCQGRHLIIPLQNIFYPSQRFIEGEIFYSFRLYYQNEEFPFIKRISSGNDLGNRFKLNVTRGSPH